MKMNDQFKLVCFFYSLVVLVVLVSLELEMELFSSLKSVLKTESYKPEDQYVIIMDAGSTGTRMHIYYFRSNLSDALYLQGEFKLITKPGLSALTDKPKKITRILSELLTVAKKKIPRKKWSEAPIALIATAGLRTIPDNDANFILKTVREVLAGSPFHYKDDSVYLLTGKQEGLYAWYGMNFLLDHQKAFTETAALIDLGGESIQIAFAEKNIDIHAMTITEIQNLEENSTVLYTKSYLGMGLMDAGVVLAQVTTEPILMIDVVERNNSVTFASPCIHPDTEEFKIYGFRRKIVKNQNSQEYGFGNCYTMAFKYLQDIIPNPLNLRKQVIYALSSHVRVAFELGLIGIEGGNSTVREFVETCKYVCNNLIPATTFTCLDCCYISAFWKHGLGLKEEKEINFRKTIRGIQVGWTLGAAFKLLESV